MKDNEEKFEQDLEDRAVGELEGVDCFDIPEGWAEVDRLKQGISDRPTLEEVKPLVDHLVYSCYSYNRRTHPGISPLAWEKIFGPNTAAMEWRFWLEEFSAKCATSGVMQALRETH